MTRCKQAKGESMQRDVMNCTILCRARAGPAAPEAPTVEPQTEPQTTPEAPPERSPSPAPFHPDWPAGRPEPQPKA
jgi:hypothetical protein